jgi:hypothetical protein
MQRPDDVAQLELLAEVDALCARLRRWADSGPVWQPAETCQALVRRLVQRADWLRVRLDAPLVVATLGGSGTGKSALVNALLGAEVARTGKSRPTTTRPVLISRPDITPEMLSIDAAAVEVVHGNLPGLRDMVLVDCPDPDTTEDPHAPATNLARLRSLLPHCDVLLVATTQQKYRSARVADELAAAAPGARLVFVQTHADQDQDIRADWRKVLDPHYEAGELFFVDSLAALADAQAGLRPRGEFARLVDLLTRHLAGAAGNRIRRANFLDLVAGTLETAAGRIEAAMPAVAALETAIQEQRTTLAARLAQQTHTELLANRRQWESRVVARITSRWGFSPFSLMLRLFQGLGGLASRAVLLRARTPAQVALWGMFEGARTWRQHRGGRRADQAAAQAAAACWEPAELHRAATILEGYATEAGLPPHDARPEMIDAEAGRAVARFAGTAAAQIDGIIGRLADRHTGWFTRGRYEILLLAMLGLLIYRLGKNFFYDSWLAAHPVAVFGIDFYLSAGLWLALWCLLLYWSFSSRLRRGLRREIEQFAQACRAPQSAAGLFARLEEDCLGVERFRQELGLVRQYVADLRRRLALPEEQLGHMREAAGGKEQATGSRVKTVASAVGN